MGELGRDLALALSSDTLWTALLVAAPILIVAMVVGLLVSIFQVVTQIQEATLSFIPKIVAVVFTLVLLGPWMMNQVVQFATRLISNIPAYF
jgi:flagellar biosynthetic protein FliQ